jgi:hypothetical protein
MTSKSLSSGGYSLLVDDIVRETLLYTNSGDEENKKLAEASIVKLKKLNELSTGQLKSEAEVFIKHSENILTRKKDLDNIVKDIINFADEGCHQPALLCNNWILQSLFESGKFVSSDIV